MALVNWDDEPRTPAQQDQLEENSAPQDGNLSSGQIWILSGLGVFYLLMVVFLIGALEL